MSKLSSWKKIEYPYETIDSPYVQIGEYTYYAGAYSEKSFEENCIRYLTEEPDKDKLIIGKFCSIATGVIFNLGGSERHLKEWVSTYPFFYIFPDCHANDSYYPKGNTIVGNDVWIGTDAIIMPGIKIGSGSIIAARAVVTKDVPPYTVVGGVPAKIIGKRFSDEDIESLLEISWWNFNIDIVKKLLPYITSSDIKTFFIKAKEFQKTKDGN